MMEVYYDSDDDVCWGPYTKREYKRDVLRSRNKEDIPCRHSVSCDPRFTYDIDKRAESLTELDAGLQPPSEYMAKSDEFIEKMSKILNDTPEKLANTLKTNNRASSEYNINLSKRNLEGSDLYFSARSDVSNTFNKAKSEEVSFTTCTAVISQVNDNTEDLACLNFNSCNHSITSQSEASTSNNASFYKNNEASRDVNEEPIITVSDSEENDSSFKFNDTLEEMDRLLNEGLNYSMSDAKDESNSQGEHVPTISLIPVPCKTKSTSSASEYSNITEEPYEPMNDFKVPEKPKKKHTPQRDRFKNIKSPVAVYINNAPFTTLYKTITPKKCTREIVCENVKPSSEKQNTENPKKKHTPQRDCFKNIKSPVTVYINNAPITPLYKTITPKKCTREIICENVKPLSEKQNTEYNTEFPEVIYRQAKKRVVTNIQGSVKLPNTIESLIATQNYVIKHVEKIGGKENSTNRRLLEDDLTIDASSDESSFNYASQSMSICESKRTFI